MSVAATNDDANNDKYASKTDRFNNQPPEEYRQRGTERDPYRIFDFKNQSALSGIDTYQSAHQANQSLKSSPQIQGFPQIHPQTKSPKN